MLTSRQERWQVFHSSIAFRLYLLRSYPGRNRSQQITTALAEAFFWFTRLEILCCRQQGSRSIHALEWVNGQFMQEAVKLKCAHKLAEKEGQGQLKEYNHKHVWPVKANKFFSVHDFGCQVCSSHIRLESVWQSHEEDIRYQLPIFKFCFRFL